MKPKDDIDFYLPPEQITQNKAFFEIEDKLLLELIKNERLFYTASTSDKGSYRQVGETYT